MLLFMACYYVVVQTKPRYPVGKSSFNCQIMLYTFPQSPLSAAALLFTITTIGACAF